MPTTKRASSDVAFTSAVKAIQTPKGSRGAYARMEERGGWETEITEELAAFVADRTASSSRRRTPRVSPTSSTAAGRQASCGCSTSTTLGFADYRGNRQYISLGNLAENPKVHLFLIDYAARRRIKIWGEATVVDDDPALLAKLMPAGYDARPEQAIVIHVTAWDVNCPQHIPQKVEANDVAKALAARDAEIAALESELARLRLGCRPSR